MPVGRRLAAHSRKTQRCVCRELHCFGQTDSITAITIERDQHVCTVFGKRVPVALATVQSINGSALVGYAMCSCLSALSWTHGQLSHHLNFASIISLIRAELLLVFLSRWPAVARRYAPCAVSIALAVPPGGALDLKMMALFGLGAVVMRGAG
jgi:hypothetical protein